jgi:hypothetical protein
VRLCAATFSFCPSSHASVKHRLSRSQTPAKSDGGVHAEGRECLAPDYNANERGRSTDALETNPNILQTVRKKYVHVPGL